MSKEEEIMKKKKLAYTSGAIIALMSLGIAATRSPKPIIGLARKTLFKIPNDQRKKRYHEKNVQVSVDECYDSQYPTNYFDFYKPDQPLPENPAILWVHGGGFIGGDKLEVKEYATKLAEAGYTVAVMNYALVPKAIYPVPVIQATECLAFLVKHHRRYDINPDNLFLAGDSAGAHIACQVVLSQLSGDYAKTTKTNKLLFGTKLRGILLYCGAYNLPDIVKNHELKIIQYIFNQIARGYANDRNWLKAERTKLTIITNYISRQFPPTYITDGNYFSFEKDGKRLVTALQGTGVPVKTRFFEKKMYRTAHEYQFNLNKRPGQLAFQDTLDFLADYRKNKKNFIYK